MSEIVSHPEADARTDELVEFLCLRMYPEKLTMAAQSEIVSGARRDEALAYLQSALEYEEELRGLNSEALRALIEDEHDKDRQAELEKAEKLESERFFNKPTARAYYRSWVERNHWTLDEATALILGKDPKVVNWDSIDPIVHKSTFARRYESLRRQFLRARFDGMLFEPLVPADFLRYAKSIGFALPIELDRLLQSDDEQRARSQQRALDEIQLAKLRKAIEEAAAPPEMMTEPVSESTPDTAADEALETGPVELEAELSDGGDAPANEADAEAGADGDRQDDREFATGAEADLTDDGADADPLSADDGDVGEIAREALAENIADEIGALIADDIHMAAGEPAYADDADRAEATISIDELSAELEADLAVATPDEADRGVIGDDDDNGAGTEVHEAETEVEAEAENGAGVEADGEPDIVPTAEQEHEAEAERENDAAIAEYIDVQPEPDIQTVNGIADDTAVAVAFTPARPATIADIAEELIRHTKTLASGNGPLNGAQARSFTDLYHDGSDEHEAETEELADDVERMPANERETLLKIFLAMAVGRYGYEPDSKRNSTVTDIVRDHEKIGLSVSATTVRKWLREASGMMPSDDA